MNKSWKQDSRHVVNTKSPDRTFEPSGVNEYGTMWTSRDWLPGERKEYCQTVLNRDLTKDELK